MVKKMKQQAGKFKKLGSLIEPLLKVNVPDWRKNQNHIFSLWENLVGEKISKKSKPDKLKINRSGGGNILYIRPLGPYGPELSLQAEEIKEKINFYFGSEFIIKVVFSPTAYNSSRQTVTVNEGPYLNKDCGHSFYKSISNKQLVAELATLKNNIVKLGKKK